MHFVTFVKKPSSNSSDDVPTLRHGLIAALLGTLVAGCVPEAAQQTSSDPAIDPIGIAQDDFDSVAIVFAPSDEADAAFDIIETAPTPEPEPWEYLSDRESDDAAGNLLRAANALSSRHRIAEAQAIADLAAQSSLEPPHSVELALIEASNALAKQNHRKAIRLLDSVSLHQVQADPDQHARMLQIYAAVFSRTGDLINLARSLIRLHDVSSDDGKRLKTGHRIIRTLLKIPFRELTIARGRTTDPVQAGWFKLAVEIYFVLHDPYQLELAADKWLQANPAHPASAILRTGILPEETLASSVIRKIAVVVPLTSNAARAAHAFSEGVSAQHAADSNPFKPDLEIYDIGSEPELTSWYVDQAIANGADYVIGPIGVKYVQAMIDHGRFGAPTLLLGDSGNFSLPDHVLQFALTPEKEGAGVASRARQNGHKFALILHPPTRWGKRVLNGFQKQWAEDDGQVVKTLEYDLNQPDYSDLTKELLNIEASAERFAIVRTAARKSLKFTPRRRQDADFIFLISDPLHGRLIKPHIDFLKAHDLPVYSTSRIFSGEPNAVNDNDLNGIRFPDVAWLIEQGEAARSLRKQLQTPWQRASQLDRLFAMGIDSYNMVYRSMLLKDNVNARYHGATSMLRINERNRLIREPNWGEFVDGVPHELPDIFLAKDPRTSRQSAASTLEQQPEEHSR